MPATRASLPTRTAREEGKAYSCPCTTHPGASTCRALPTAVPHNTKYKDSTKRQRVQIQMEVGLTARSSRALVLASTEREEVPSCSSPAPPSDVAKRGFAAAVVAKMLPRFATVLLRVEEEAVRFATRCSWWLDSVVDERAALLADRAVTRCHKPRRCEMHTMSPHTMSSRREAMTTVLHAMDRNALSPPLQEVEVIAPSGKPPTRPAAAPNAALIRSPAGVSDSPAAESYAAASLHQPVVPFAGR